MKNHSIIEAKKNKEEKVTFELFISLFGYEPETGRFYRKEYADIGDGCQGYRKISISIDGKRLFVKAHRAAFLVMTGKWPVGDVDHADLDKSNNKWTNLREATSSQNLSNMKIFKNNTSGFKGVSYRKNLKKWAAYITHHKKRIHLGLFVDPVSAHAAYCAKAKELKKEFFRSS